VSLPADTAVAVRPPTPARDLFFLSLLFAVVYFLPTGLRPLTNPDEGRYVEIAREMAVNHDFVSPHLNGVLYFEKPPLFYWLETSAVALGGTNLWVLRFWPIALAFLGAAAVYGTGRALWGRAAGWWSALALSTCLLYYGVSQVIILDTAVSVFLTWAMCAFMLAVRAPPGRTRRNWCCALYASMALALMTKGLIGLLIPSAIIFLWLLLLNKWRELRHAYIVLGILILLVLGLPWHIAAALATPPPGGWDWAHFFSRDWHNQGFLWYYFVQQQFLRYLDHSVANRVQPWWFFFVLLPAGFFPWVLFLPSAIGSAIKGGWARIKSEPETLFLFLWALFPLLFFSASSSKLPPYILPSVPPLALLTGRYLANLIAQPTAHTSVRSKMWAIVIVTALILAAVNPVAAHFLAVKKPSTASAAEWLRPRLQPGDQVFTLLDFGPYQDFPPLLGRTIGIAGQIPDEQEFGLMLEPDKNAARYPGLADYLALRRNADKSPPTNEQIQSALLTPFVALLRSSAHIYALASADHFAIFRKMYPDAPAHIVWQGANLVLISNQMAAK
jgi:4-amino-4-deoxy-L-arabinose transferase-like glycosyltransferase